MSKPPNLLIVDDDRELTAMLAEYLTREGFALAVENTGAGAVTAILKRLPDLVILDVMLSGTSGLDHLREIRRMQIHVPVLMLTALGEETDRVVGLELGADDYLTKPFNPRELAARIRAILRRAATPPGGSVIQRLGSVELDSGQRRISVAGEKVEATGAEFGVLQELMRQPGQVISRAELTERALGRPLALYDRSIDTHVSNLRRKLESAQVEIRNVRGAGYILIAGKSQNA